MEGISMLNINTRFKLLIAFFIVSLIFTYVSLNAIEIPTDKNVVNYFEQLNKKTEKVAFTKLNKITIDKLQPGDILLKKDYESKSTVVGMQKKLFSASKKETYIAPKDFKFSKNARGSYFSAHALLYIGDTIKGKNEKGENIVHNIAESSNSKNGVYSGKLSEYSHYGLIVYRCKNVTSVKEALNLAKKWTKDEKIKYSSKHCLTAFSNSSTFGSDAKKRALKVALKKEPPTKNMMCSEFVTYTYQAVKPFAIKLDAQHTAPIRLEEYLNKAVNFQLIGRIHPKP